MHIQSTIRSDAAGPIRTKRLEESQAAHAPAMMIADSTPKHVARHDGLPTPSVADNTPVMVSAGDAKRSLDDVTLSALGDFSKSVMTHIDPRLGHAYDGAMLLVGDVELVQRWLDRDEDEHTALILDTVETVLDHAELAARYMPALKDYVPWIKTVGVIVKVGKTTHKALVELDERQDAKTVVALQKASALRFLDRSAGDGRAASTAKPPTER